MASVLTLPIPFPIRWFSLVNGNTLNSLFGAPQFSSESAITATAGGTKATARLLKATVNQVSVCATTGDSLKLPANPLPGNMVFIANDGAAAADIYGSNNDTIDGVATATGVVLSNASRSFFFCASVSAGVANWVSQAGAKSS
jgi:hypothetical protein